MYGDEGHARIIHRFWAGRKIPDEYEIYGWMWQDLNPGWQVLLWDESCLVDFPALKPVFDSLYERDAGRHGIELYVQLADVVAYALVHRWGGIYVNCDMQPVRPLPDDLPDRAWASYENNIGDVVNAAFGAPDPQDVFWEKVLTRLPEKYFANPTAEMVLTTGPSLLTEQARQHPGLIHVYPVPTFNPIHWSKIVPGGDAHEFIDQLPPETIAVHHWGHKKDGRSNVVETATPMLERAEVVERISPTIEVTPPLETV